MICLFFLTTIFFLSEATLPEELFVFDEDQNALYKCIEFNLLNDDDSLDKDIIATEITALYVAKRFSGKTLKYYHISRQVSYLLYYLRNKKDFLFENQKLYSLRAVQEALIYCADPSNLKPSDIKFEGESPELASVLDFILVDWPVTLEEMVKTRKGRMILRKFSEDALIPFNRALRSLQDPSRFRNAVLENWMHRARFYFDDRDAKFPTISHSYTIDRGIRIKGNLRNMILTEGAKQFVEYHVPEMAVKSFLSVHDADRPPYTEHDIFSQYEQNGMTVAEYFIETHIDQFYRVLIFNIDSKLYGVFSNDTDTYYNKRIPYNVLRKESQELLFDNQVYRQILIVTRQNLETVLNKTQTEIALILSTPNFLKERGNSWLFGITTRRPISDTASLEQQTSTVESGYKSDYDYDADCDITEGDDYVYDSCDTDNVFETDDELKVDPIPVPDFWDEPHDVGIVLDYILVDWQVPLITMIRTRGGRKILRKYTEDAQSLLENALKSSMSHDHFRYLLRSLWMFRAMRYFDGYDAQVPYLRHLYSLQHPFPHFYEDQNIVLNRNARQLVDRNPQMSECYINRIVYMHGVDQFYNYNNDKNDFYSIYEKNGMTSSQHYIETFIDQFYRILFCFMELKLYGIQSDEDDIWEGPIPYEVVPGFLQEIVYDDERYRNFLLSERRRLVRKLNEAQIELRQCLFSARVIEEYLFSALRLLISHRKTINRAASTTTIGTRYVTNPEISTTPKYGERKRKGSVWVNSEGKHFLKRPRDTFPESCCYGSSYSSDFRMYTEACLRQRYNYTVINSADYAFSVCSILNDSRQSPQFSVTRKGYYGFMEDGHLEFPFEKESSSFKEILRDNFLPVIESSMKLLRQC